MKAEITDELSKDHGYMNLDVVELQRQEVQRKTAVGLEILTFN
jgi:cupin superfamily acireductone dioxygenase involved in methionine salvage